MDAQGGEADRRRPAITLAAFDGSSPRASRSKAEEPRGAADLEGNVAWAGHAALVARRC